MILKWIQSIRNILNTVIKKKTFYRINISNFLLGNGHISFQTAMISATSMPTPPQKHSQVPLEYLLMFFGKTKVTLRNTQEAF